MAERWRLLLFASILLCSLPAPAHKLKLFALAEGETIQGQAYFVGGAGAGGAEIRIYDGEGHELARLQPDAEGRFSYRIERVMDYEVVADTRDGHRMSWFLKAAEFSPGPEAMAPAVGSEGEAGSSAAPSSGTEPDRLAQDACAQIVSRQTQSLSEALRACEERRRLRDVLGGLGFIAGLAGFGLWWRSRRREGP